ncbi:MAG: hypothetical protein JNG85_02450 [Spirochaetaceae bacterium]|nr:hypothetical protein [Spirochaetaceae bacterium]
MSNRLDRSRAALGAAGLALALSLALASCATVDKPKGEVKRSPQLTEGQLQELYIVKRNDGRRYLEANEIRQNMPAVLLGIGRAYIGLEYPEKAKKYLDKYLEVEKENDVAAYREIAAAYAGPIGAYDAAAKTYTRALAAGGGKDSGWDYLRRGEVLLRLGKRDDALADFNRAMEEAQRGKDAKLLQAAKDAIVGAS